MKTKKTFLKRLLNVDWTNSVKKTADNQELSRQKTPRNQYVVFQQMKTNKTFIKRLLDADWTNSVKKTADNQ